MNLLEYQQAKDLFDEPGQHFVDVTSKAASNWMWDRYFPSAASTAVLQTIDELRRQCEMEVLSWTDILSDSAAAHRSLIWL